MVRQSVFCGLRLVGVERPHVQPSLTDNSEAYGPFVPCFCRPRKQAPFSPASVDGHMISKLESNEVTGITFVKYRLRRYSEALGQLDERMVKSHPTLRLLARERAAMRAPAAELEGEFVRHEELILYHLSPEGRLGACRLSWADQSLDKECEMTVDDVETFIRAMRQMGEPMELIEYKLRTQLRFGTVNSHLTSMTSDFAPQYRQSRYNQQLFNCQHFCAELLRKLPVEKMVQSEITHRAIEEEDTSQTPSAAHDDPSSGPLPSVLCSPQGQLPPALCSPQQPFRFHAMQ